MTTVPTWVSIAEQFVDPAETRFEIRPVADAGSDEVVMEMPAGRWTNPSTTSVSAGLLAMLVDSAGGTANFVSYGAQQWTVSSELSVDLVAPLPAGATTARAAGRTTALDDSTALSLSTVTVDGRVVGVGTVRTHPIPSGDALMGLPDDELTGADRDDITRMLGLGSPVGDDVDSAAALADPSLQNGIGIVHGGVIVAAAETVASATMNRDRATPLATGAVRANYLRPMFTGGQARYEARIVRAGRSTALVDVAAIGADGRTAAVVRVTGYAVGS